MIYFLEWLTNSFTKFQSRLYLFSQRLQNCFVFSIVLFSFLLGSCAFGPTTTSRDLLNRNGFSDDGSLLSNEANTSTKQSSRQLAQDQNPQFSETSFANSASRFDWPVLDARMTRGYLPHKRRPHLGIDLAAPRGTPILAAHSGLVLYAGRDFKGYGKMILIESGNGWATLYAHLDKILVEEGQKVTPSDIIGQMGRTGRATGVHLHFELRKNKGPVDPLEYLPGGQQVAKNAAI